MSNAITLFAGASAILQDLKVGLPAYLSDEKTRAELAAYNDDVSIGQQFPTLSIKGKVFTLNKDGERKRLMKNEDEVLQSIQVTVVRANPNARVFYAGEYVEGTEGEAARPDCYSNDGVAPASDARDPQSHKCAVCPHAVWGTGNRGEGTACTVNTRLAIVAPELLAAGNAEPTLLRVPAGSRRNFSDFVNVTKRHGSPYFAAVVKVGFDPEAPAPKLTFKLMGYLNDEAFAGVRKLVDDPAVLDMVGATPKTKDQAALPAPDEAANAAVTKAQKATPAPAPAPAPAPTPAPAPADDDGDDDGVEDVMPKAAPKPAAKKTARATPASKPAPEGESSSMLDDLDALLGKTDD